MATRSLCGEVVGASNLAGSTMLHVFLSTRDTRMRDLGGLGGDYGHPDWKNDRGDVVGFAYTAKDGGHSEGRAFFWHDGTMQNLGTICTDQSSGLTASTTAARSSARPPSSTATI